MDHSALYKPKFCIKSDRRLNESKTVRQQKRNECFQQGRLMAISPTPKKINQDHSNIDHRKVEEDVNESALLTIPLSPHVDKENLCNHNNNKYNKKSTDINLKVPATKRSSIKSKIERQQVFLNRFSEWKKNKEIKKLQQSKTTKPKPFVAACFKNPVFGEYNNTMNTMKAKSQNKNTEFKFKMNYVLLPPPQSAVATKKIVKSESICKKKSDAKIAKTKINNGVNRKPLETFNKIVQKDVMPSIVEPEIKLTKSVTKKSGHQSPVKSKTLKNSVYKNEINKFPVNTKKRVQNDKSPVSGPYLFKKPMIESNNNQPKKVFTLKRPPIFFKSNKKDTKMINQKPADNINFHKKNELEVVENIDASQVPTNIDFLETTNIDRKKSTPLDYVTSTIRKYPGDSLPSPLDLEESVIKPTSTSLENDLKPIVSSSDENSPLVKKIEVKSSDFNLNEPENNDDIISKENNKITPSRRVSERLSTKKKRTCCSGDYFIDIWSRTPAQSSTNHQTPPQSIIKENQNYYMSPQVAVSRGKVNARKEREKRDSIYLVDVNSPKNSLMKRTKETISYFRAQLKDEQARLLKLCSDWLDYLKTLNSDVISDVAGPMVNAAIGVTNLLISKKMKKFETLIERCEETVTTDKFDNVNTEHLDDSFKPVQIQDLDGFWCIIRQQIEDLEKRFNNLVIWKDNDWNDPDFLVPIKKKERTKNNVIKKKKIIKSETFGNPKLRDVIKRMRNERLKELQVKNCSSNGLNEIVEIITPNQRNTPRKSLNIDEVKKVVPKELSDVTAKNTSARRSGRISQIISSTRRSSTPRSSRKSAKKVHKNTLSFEELNLISLTKTPELQLRKSILKTPGTARKNCNVLFHERIADFKSPECISPEGRVSLGRTRGGTRRKRVSTRELLFTNE